MRRRYLRNWWVSRRELKLSNSRNGVSPFFSFILFWEELVRWNENGVHNVRKSFHPHKCRRKERTGKRQEGSDTREFSRRKQNRSLLFFEMSHHFMDGWRSNDKQRETELYLWGFCFGSLWVGCFVTFLAHLSQSVFDNIADMMECKGIFRQLQLFAVYLQSPFVQSTRLNYCTLQTRKTRRFAIPFWTSRTGNHQDGTPDCFTTAVHLHPQGMKVFCGRIVSRQSKNLSSPFHACRHVHSSKSLAPLQQLKGRKIVADTKQISFLSEPSSFFEHFRVPPSHH